MRILIVTPAAKWTRKGNWITADRWARLLRCLGQRVELAAEYDGQRCDLLVALHARKSAASVRRFRRDRSDAPIIVALTGTDLYHDLRRSRAAQRSLELADRLIVLQKCALEELPPSARTKARVIVQSALPPPVRPEPIRGFFDVCVIGHLRPIKDPFRAALAARRLPPESRIRVTHLGEALSLAFVRQAREEFVRNPRYRWLSNRPHPETLRVLARSRLLVNSSKSEGGANAISEAIACGVPVLSSRIPGSIGLLGDDYPGYFDVGDTVALTRLLLRCETDVAFYESLLSHIRRLAPLVSPERERAAWRDLLAEIRLKETSR